MTTYGPGAKVCSRCHGCGYTFVHGIRCACSKCNGTGWIEILVEIIKFILPIRNNKGGSK